MTEQVRATGPVQAVPALAPVTQPAAPTESLLPAAGNAAVAHVLSGSGGHGLPDDGAGGVNPRLIDSVQRLAGNAAATRWLQRLTGGRVVQRDDAAVALTGVSVNNAKVTFPLESGVTLRATAKPANATDVKFSLEAGGASPAAGTTIDETSGAITVDAKQDGGDMKVKATGASNWVDSPFELVAMPKAITATSGTAAGGTDYGGGFVHTFSAASGSASGLKNANINEQFDSLSASTPFAGGKFSLQANAAGSTGWFLDSSGAMTSPDNVTIGSTGIDIGDFTKSASNPSPKTGLPAGFSMTQHFKAKSLPSGQLQQFTDTTHRRTLNADATFEVAAGMDKVSKPYTGPPAFTNAKASPSTIMASPPKPKSGTWQQAKVQVTCDVVPSTESAKFKITGPALGCKVDAGGEVSIGADPGAVTVRVSGKGTHFDEVQITITPYKAPTTQPTNPSPTGALGALDQGPDEEPMAVGAGGVDGRIRVQSLSASARTNPKRSTRR